MAGRFWKGRQSGPMEHRVQGWESQWAMWTSVRSAREGLLARHWAACKPRSAGGRPAPGQGVHVCVRTQLPPIAAWGWKGPGYAFNMNPGSAHL